MLWRNGSIFGYQYFQCFKSAGVVDHYKHFTDYVDFPRGIRDEI